MTGPKVLFVVGAGRSGSTILGNVLAEVDGFVHVGELLDSWSPLAKDRSCGCGETLDRCGFWSTVMAEVFEGMGQELTPAGVGRWREQSVRYRHVPRLLRQVRSPDEQDPGLLRYLRLIGDLYSVISTRTGAGVVVDSSKSGPDAVLLGSVRGIRPYFVHLVRDPRAVSYSWLRLKRVRGESGPPQLQHWTPARVGRNWLLVQGLIEVIRRRDQRHPWLTVRYEDLATAPMHTVSRILDLLDEPRPALPFVDEHTVALGPNHTAGGNRSRFNQGQVTIRSDDEWISAQSRRDRLVVTALTGLLLPRYRYALRPSPGGGS